MRKHPEVLSSYDILGPLEPLLAKNLASVDWHSVTEKMQNILRAEFVRQAAGFNNKDIAWFVVAKDTSRTLGFAQFVAYHDDQEGTMGIPNVMIVPEGQHRGIGKLLISSIFKILPPTLTIKALALTVMNLNTHAIDAYTSYGFVGKPSTQDPLGSYCMAYTIAHSNTLQKEAERLA